MNKHFCFYCMSPVGEDGTCPVCGLTAGAYRPAPHHLPPGTILGNRYLIGRVLGEGGFGITYIACDLRLDLKVAIKEYFPTDKATRHAASSLDVTSYTGAATSNYESSKRKFLSEARIMAKMDKQPEVISVRDFFEVNNTAYIVMEFVDGTNFRELVKQQGGKIPAQQLLATIEPLFHALSAMHSAGLVHRDISPDNLMLEHGKVRLLDFGCARESATGTDTLTIALKHGFAPIEQYTNHGQGPWTDIYALAGTIYFCVTGKTPVRSTDRLLGDELLLPSKLGVDLTRQQEKVLLRAMSIQPRRRYQTMEEFRAALYAPEEEPISISVEPDVDELEGLAEVEYAPEDTAEPIRHTAGSEEEIQKTQTAVQTEQQEKPEKPKKPKRLILVAAGGVAGLALLITAVAMGVSGRFQKAPEPVEPPPAAETENSTTLPAAELESPEFPDSPSSENVELISGPCGPLAQWSLNPDLGLLTVTGRGAMQNYREGEQPWADYADSITGIVVTGQVTQIGDWSFGWLNNLKSVVLGPSVTHICDSAFDHSALAEIILPNGLVSIGDDAFSGTALTQIEIPEQVVSLGDRVFEHCPNLRQVTFRGQGTRLSYGVGNGMFTNENGEIPEDFTLLGYSCSTVENYAKAYGYNFQSIGESRWELQGGCGDNILFYLDLDSGLLALEGTGAMWDFHGTWEKGANGYTPSPEELPPWSEWRGNICCVSIGDGITRVGENAFENCTNLTDVHWGNTVESIGFHSFLSTALTEIVLPGSLQKMSDFAFNYCQKLRRVVLPEGFPELEESVFSTCPNLQEIYIGRDTVIRNNGILTPFNQDNPGEQELPAGLTIYGFPGSDAERFAGEYDIPFAIGYRGLQADSEGQCGDDAWWFVDDAQDTLVIYGAGDTWDFEDGPQALPYRTNSNIRHAIVLPGIEAVGDGLLAYLDELETVELGTVKQIGLSALRNTAVREVVIPETVELVRGWSFAGCEQLTTVTIAGPCQMELSVFYNTPSLREVTFGPEVKMQDGEEGNLFCQVDSPPPYTPSDELVFRGTKASDAYRYARQYGIQFEAIVP